MIHVFIGTKAQYIKTAPLLRLLDERQVDYRLIDSGQHAALSSSLRAELGIRSPDLLLGDDRDVNSIPQALRWMLSLAWRLRSGGRLRRDVFAGEGGICVVHGDTPSTLLSTFMAKRAGVDVAHIEAGLRSHNWFQPFPEELVRILVMRRADVLFAPDTTAVDNLSAMNVRGQIVALGGNTSIEAVRDAGAQPGDGLGEAIVTMHRVENLHRKTRREGFVDLVERIATTTRVRFILHEPTRTALAGASLDRLQSAGVSLTPLIPHGEFIRLLAAAPFVVTDGGSIQEECALLGVPTLLWRDRTERPDGLDANIVLGHHDRAISRRFLDNVESYRRTPLTPDVSPSEQILSVLGDWRQIH